MWACQFATSGSTVGMGGSQNFVHGINHEKNKQDFTVDIYFIYSMALIKSTVQYRDLGGFGTVNLVRCIP